MSTDTRKLRRESNAQAFTSYVGDAASLGTSYTPAEDEATWKQNVHDVLVRAHATKLEWQLGNVVLGTGKKRDAKESKDKCLECLTAFNQAAKTDAKAWVFSGLWKLLQEAIA